MKSTNFIATNNSIAQSFRTGTINIKDDLRRSRRYSNVEGRERPHQILNFIIHSPKGLCYGKIIKRRFLDAVS